MCLHKVEFSRQALLLCIVNIVLNLRMHLAFTTQVLTPYIQLTSIQSPVQAGPVKHLTVLSTKTAVIMVSIAATRTIRCKADIIQFDSSSSLSLTVI